MRTLIGNALGVLGFAALMGLAAQVAVPMHPVPMTMQTWAVLLAGGVLGARCGVVSVLVYMLAAALGLPVLSDGASGIERFTGPTAGYLAAFPIGAALAGVAAGRGWLRRPVTGWGVLMAGHLIILGLGTARLARDLGAQAALEVGFTPLLIGAGLKSALVLACLWALRNARPSPG